MPALQLRPTRPAAPFAALLFALLLPLALSGCALPQWRVFQAKVPADPGPSAATLETQRRAAQYIALASAPRAVAPAPGAAAPRGPAAPGAGPAEPATAPDGYALRQLEKIHAVAAPLSHSLGEPQRPAADTPADQAALIAALRTTTLEAQARAEQWRAFAKKYAGTPLEDTGLNLAGPTGLLALAALVALCVLCPPIGYALLRVLPLLWSFFRRTTSAISGYIEEHPDGAEKLKEKLSRKMDEGHKALVRRHAAR